MARTRARPSGQSRVALLILDEIQKLPGWSETVKRLWDEDTASRLPLQVVTLGSSALLMPHELTESLAGRFAVVPVTPWSLAEMQQAFGWDMEHYIFYGGYPGAAALITDHQRWARYIVDGRTHENVPTVNHYTFCVESGSFCRHVFKRHREIKQFGQRAIWRPFVTLESVTKAPNDLISRRCVSRISSNIEKHANRQCGSGHHPIGEGLEDALTLIDGIARNKNGLLSSRKELAHYDTCVSIRRRPGFRSGRDQVDYVFRYGPLSAILKDYIKHGGYLIGRKASLLIPL